MTAETVIMAKQTVLMPHLGNVLNGNLLFNLVWLGNVI
jgi:hypothetical protein